jgi:excinuclease ABC subunit A
MSAIVIKGIKVHNLKNVDISIPHGQLTVMSGVSGSGKSSLAIDTLYAEGQRRFIESLSAYVRQFLERMERPQVDFVSGMLPAVVIESKNSITNARSTVGTQTEVNDYLRLLFARIGITYCPSCGDSVKKDSPNDIARFLLGHPETPVILITFPISIEKKNKKYLKNYLEEISRQGFSRLYCGGEVLKLSDKEEIERVCKETSFDVVVDRVVLKDGIEKRLIDSLETAYRHGKGFLSIVYVDSKENTRVAYSNHFHCARCDRAFHELNPNMFSFNSPLGACPECQGFGRVVTVDMSLVVPDESKSLSEGAIVPWTTKAGQWEYSELMKYCQIQKIPTTIPFRELKEKDKRSILDGNNDFFGVRGFFQYLEKKKYKMHVRVFLSRYRAYTICPLCQGKRLKEHVLHVKIQGKSINDMSSMTIDALHDFFKALTVSVYEEKIAATVLGEIRSRIRFLKEVGLGYLTLDRLSRTLSGGEAQRINLASALGSNLVDTLYVLDEPSVGLHARDNSLLIGILKELKKIGNTVVVIEHDLAMIKEADMVMDLGPGAGERGGCIVFRGTYAQLQKAKNSLTAKYIRKELSVDLEKKYLVNKKHHALRTKNIDVRGAHEHNLKNIDLTIPLGRLVVLTGVSGSGKSTFLYNILYNNFLRSRGRSVSDVGVVSSIKGYENIADIVLVDQTPIGRTPRSNPVTFIDAFSPIRTLFASSRSAQLRKKLSGDFSFNVDGGRCDACKGDGRVKVEMHFLADMYVVCEACNGTRYKKEILDIRYNGKNIHEVLEMTVDEALSFFAASPKIAAKIQVLQDVGLGYLRLGQPAPTLSAGEAQRLKLAIELSDTHKSNILFLFDEPTVGLHSHDISALMRAIEKLLERGNSIVMIEHNMDVIKCADYIVDLGPEGGDKGGSIVGMGTPREIARIKESYTGIFLKKVL